MFSLPPLTTRGEQKRGPAVDIHDNAEYFEGIVRTFVGLPYICLSQANAFVDRDIFSDSIDYSHIRFRTACSMLCLSTKHIMPHIYKRSIEALEHIFPSSLDEYLSWFQD